MAELGVLVGFAWLGATSVRRRLVPRLDGLVAQLTTALLAIAGLLWVAEVLGAFGWFKVGPYLAAVVVVGAGLRLLVEGPWGRPSVLLGFSPGEPEAVRGWEGGEKEDAAAPEGRPPGPSPAALVALAIAAVAVVHFAAGVKLRLSTGMTGFDSTWYHGPFAAGFFQSGDTWSLHFIAPQFLAWFYPANSEVLHAVGMVAFSRDILSPLLNLGWFVGCLVAAWCIGRPYRVAPWSLALVAIALSVPALHDQAGEARNDIVGIFFLLAAVAVALAQRERSSKWQASETAFALGPVVVVGIAAGMAAGTKLNFLLPAAVLVVGIALVAPRGRRWRALVAGGLAALAGGGYWYLRNLVHTGNPLPWVKHLGPIALPAPAQALGGREDHSVLGYLTNGSVWSDWFLPGLHHGLTILWPLIAALAIGGLVLCLGRRSDPILRVVAAVGLAAGLAWLIAPTSASGPDGMPQGFESGLRYLAPALVLGLAVLPLALLPRVAWWRGAPMAEGVRSASEHMGEGRRDRTRGPLAIATLIVLVAAIALGYPIQRHYLERRYADPSFTTPGLNAAFAWAQDISDARIATTSTRQYPLYGRDLSNEVTYIGTEQPHGGFTAPTTCLRWRRLLNEGNYDYVVTSRDRIEPNKPPYPPTARWTAAPGATVVLRKPPTVIYKLRTPLDPSACR
ncbi:MAG TPA: hypothetical protein VH042_02995 [Solirubrobacterales bacterium]|nr:hypothetical protein [Solirubrobacterales bacterium]